MKKEDKKRWRKYLNKRASAAYFQIAMLTLSIIAVTFMIASIKGVEAGEYSFDSFTIEGGKIYAYTSSTGKSKNTNLFVENNNQVWLNRNLLFGRRDKQVGTFDPGTDKITLWDRYKDYVDEIPIDYYDAIMGTGDNRAALKIYNRDSSSQSIQLTSAPGAGIASPTIQTGSPARLSNADTNPPATPLATSPGSLGGDKIWGTWGEGNKNKGYIQDGMLYDKSGYLVDQYYKESFKQDSSQPPGTTPPPAPGTTKPGVMDFLGGIAMDAGIAAGLAGAILLFGNMVTDDKSKVQAAAAAVGGGFFAGKLTYRLIKQFASPTGWIGKHAGLVSIGVGAAVAIAIFLLMYKKENEEVVYFECYPWDAPVGGENCEKCNKQGILPCSEYQCKSLGQACELLNPGTDEELCTWVHRQDVKPPVIVPWEEALLPDYKYIPDTSISPPDRGVKIINKESTSGCAKAFTPISFGVTIDEPAKCKVDYIRKKNFDDMSFFMGGSSLFNYNHSQVLSLPGPGSLNAEAPILQNDGEYELFVKCMDANGNENTGNFVFGFCVEKGPDTTPPMIVTTSVLDRMPVAYNQSSIDIEIYVNEPATCKWSPRDQTYDKMENEMVCATSVFEMNAQMLYKCKTTLTGLKNRQDNNFYFKCKDQPLKPERDRNVNQQSYPLTLVGTEPVYISSVGPEGVIKDSTDIIRVELTAKTSAGYKEGEANCYYSDTGTDDSYILFYNSGSYEHSQELFLAEGSYKYYIKCIDLGGNSDEKTVEFKVESDSSAPMVVRVYHEDTYLKLITDEKAECVYSKDSCEYSIIDGIIIKAVDGTQHYTDWNTNFNYYIKCQDEYGNQPMPNACSIIVRPFDIYAGK